MDMVLDRPSEIQIERGVPIAPDGRGRRRVYPWHQMGVGDSIFVATDNPSHHPVRRAASFWAKRHGRIFCSRKVEGGVRVWRVA